ncbi:RNA polymerase sigma factor [Bacillus phage 000TH008]|nr:RNA polymerase sigma factor [Bacillus phage 000TH008]QQO40844.1 RNA polymerase sigma factor [Bacillus phage 000TH009]
MKLLVKTQHERGTEDNVILRVSVNRTGETFVAMPLENLHYWYPFNINFSYKFSESRGGLVLVKERGYEGHNFYNAPSTLKEAELLKKKDGFFLNQKVYERNTYIIEKAKKLNLPVITDDTYNSRDIAKGFLRLQYLMGLVKKDIENNYKMYQEVTSAPETELDEEWDHKMFESMSTIHKNAYIEFGEMYSMLVTMNKIAKRRAI